MTGKFPVTIFTEAGFDTKMLGKERYKSAAKRWRTNYKKYGLACLIRKANPYKRIIRATQEHHVLKNILKRKFKQGILGKILLTDITYLFMETSSVLTYLP